MDEQTVTLSADEATRLASRANDADALSSMLLLSSQKLDEAKKRCDCWREVAKQFWRHLDTYGVVAEVKSGIHIPLNATDPEWKSQDACFRAYDDMVQRTNGVVL